MEEGRNSHALRLMTNFVIKQKKWNEPLFQQSFTFLIFFFGKAIFGLFHVQRICYHLCSCHSMPGLWFHDGTTVSGQHQSVRVSRPISEIWVRIVINYLQLGGLTGSSKDLRAKKLRPTGPWSKVSHKDHISNFGFAYFAQVNIR